MNSWIILIPTILTIIVCLWTKQIYIGMFAGIFSGCIILAGGNPLVGLDMSFNKLMGVAASGWNMKIILFAVLIGGMIKLMQVSGGVNGLIKWLTEKANVTTPAKAQAVTATIGKTLADKYGYSREKCAYLVDSTASPVCALLPLNSWGAYIIGLLASLGVADTMGTMVKAIPVNFYCIIALAFCMVVVFKNWNLGGMKEAEEKCKADLSIVEEFVGKDEKVSSPLLVVLPILVIIASVIGALLITGKGVITDGDTSVAVFYSMIIGNVVTILLCMALAKMNIKEACSQCLKGCGEMVPVAMLLVFAFCLSGICGELGIGGYISALTAAHLPNFIVPALVFITAALMAFATGSSWGTFAIVIPIVVPMAAATGLPLYLLVSAQLSGAIMGDHCSMISDSTVMASAFSGCDNVKHFRTQLPYALISAAAAVVLYIVTGLILG